jgi:hypothetical protein
MKKALSFALGVIILTMTVSAMADIDLSVFEPNDFAMQLDETAGSIVVQKLDGEYPSTNTDNGTATVIPQVIISGEGYAAFRLLILFLTPEGGYTKDVIFSADDASYTFTAVSPDGTHVTHMGVSALSELRMDIAAIRLGNKSYPLLKAIFDNPAIDVQVQFIRTDTIEIFKLDDYAKKAIGLLYNGFVNAGGLSQSAAAADKVEAEATIIVVE